MRFTFMKIRMDERWVFEIGRRVIKGIDMEERGFKGVIRWKFQEALAGARGSETGCSFQSGRRKWQV